MSFEERSARSAGAGIAAGGPAVTRAGKGLGAPPGESRGRGLGERFGATERTDAWWLEPVVQGLALLVLGAYATWAAFQGRNYEFGNYLSRFYSPLLRPKWWRLSPAVLVLGAPPGFGCTRDLLRHACYRHV